MLEKNGTAHKICFKCKILKQLDEFYSNKRNKDGKTARCKTCHSKKPKTICELCFVNINEEFVKTFDVNNYKKLHGFCRNCRKQLRKYQLLHGGKTCTKCNISQPFGNFPHHKHTYDNFDSWCKNCRKLYRYEVNQSLDTHVRQILERVKFDRRKFDYDIDLPYLIELWNKQKGLCAISGLNMSHQRSKRAHNLFNASLDRINSNLPYLKNNVQWVCWMINRMKGENSIEELINMCKRIIKHNYSKNKKSRNLCH